jgi:hypothetical protein
VVIYLKIKALRLNLNGVNNKCLSGQLINLISNDGARLEVSLYYIPYFVIGPVQTLVIMYLLVTTIHVSILSGLVVLLVAIPFQSLLGKLFNRLRFFFIIVI